MKRLLIGGLLLVLSAISISQAEEKKPAPSPQESKQQLEDTFGAMIPLTGKMVEAMMETQLTVLAKPESAEKVARYIKNLHDALIKQGFSKDEAMKIVTSLPIPSAPSSK